MNVIHYIMNVTDKMSSLIILENTKDHNVSTMQSDKNSEICTLENKDNQMCMLEANKEEMMCTVKCNADTAICSYDDNRDHQINILSSKKLHFCPSCSYSSDKTTNLSRHLAIHTREYPYHCQMCGKGFIQKIHCEKHQRTHKDQNNIMQSPENGLSKLRLPIHKKYPLQCPNYMCPYTTDKTTNLRRHIATHTQERPFQCSICSKRFTQKSHAEKHQKIHTKNQVLNIQVSGNNIDLTKQVMVMHSYRCPHNNCSYTTDKEINLKKHLIAHTQERPFECPDCGKRFTQKSHVERHFKSHAQKELTYDGNHKRPHRFQCPHLNCLYSTDKTTSLRKHIATHTQECICQCPHCGKEFSQKISVKGQQNIHGKLVSVTDGEVSEIADTAKKTDLIRPRRYQCPNYPCSYSTDKTTNLRRHIATHTQERPYRCTECAKGFIQKGHLDKHYLTHKAKEPVNQLNETSKGLVSVEQPQQPTTFQCPLPSGECILQCSMRTIQPTFIMSDYAEAAVVRNIKEDLQGTHIFRELIAERLKVQAS